MVCFACFTCGESLKKNQVEKHKYKCAMTSLSCFDCHKDFDQESYVAHYSCVTEAERVQGSLYKAKENKAEKKRKMWTDAIYKAIKNAKDGQVRKLLNSIKDEPNTPMKEVPFKNFLKNKGMTNPITATEAFRLIKEAAEETQKEPSKSTAEEIQEEVSKKPKLEETQKQSKKSKVVSSE